MPSELFAVPGLTQLFGLLTTSTTASTVPAVSGVPPLSVSDDVPDELEELQAATKATAPTTEKRTAARLITARILAGAPSPSNPMCEWRGCNDS
jgi:hypothetical protein